MSRQGRWSEPGEETRIWKRGILQAQYPSACDSSRDLQRTVSSCRNILTKNRFTARQSNAACSKLSYRIYRSKGQLPFATSAGVPTAFFSIFWLENQTNFGMYSSGTKDGDGEAGGRKGAKKYPESRREPFGAKRETRVRAPLANLYCY